MQCNGSRQSRRPHFIRLNIDIDPDPVCRRPDPQVRGEVLFRDNSARHKVLRAILRVPRARGGLRGPREVGLAVRLPSARHPDQHDLKRGHATF